jgi:effector-binding domain-containing protein
MAADRVEIAQQPAVSLAVVRRQVHVSELAQVVPECCGLVWQAVKAQKVPAGRHVAVYWDDSIRLEVGVELLGPFVDDGEVVNSATPAGAVATLTHLGPYDGLGRAHEALRGWCQAHGHRPAGPAWEVYGHWQRAWDDDPSRIRTDVFVLLERR